MASGEVSGLTRPGHVSRWPAYPPRPSKRKLAWLTDDGAIIAPTGEVLGRPRDWQEYIDITTGEDSYLILTDKLARSQWLMPALSSPAGEVTCTKAGHVQSIRARGHKNRVSILIDRGEQTGWDAGGKTEPYELMKELRLLFMHHNSGPQSTPGALGAYGMSRAYLDAGNRPRSRPSQFLRSRLYRHSVGGLADAPGKGGTFDQLWEIDRRSAYAAEASQDLPDGTPVKLLAGYRHHAEYPYWFARCIVHLPLSLPIPLIGAPVPGGVTFRPRAAGWYGGKTSGVEVWLWSTEAAALSEVAGATIYPGEGWGWRYSCRPLAGWADRLWELRNSAPSERVSKWTKQVMVAGVGRMGMHPTRYELMLASEAGKRGMPVTVNSWPPITEYVVVEDADPETTAPVDWHSFIVARARVTLWKRAIAEIEAGRKVYSVDHDSIVMDGPATLPINPAELGNWKETPLHHVYIPEVRQMVSDEVVKLPGVPLAGR